MTSPHARADRVKKAKASLSFRRLDTFTEEELKKNNYYVGYTCPLGHHIRDVEKHWCYKCVERILNNVCSFDINYIHSKYNSSAYDVWRYVTPGEANECWPVSKTGRVNFPSYRSLWDKNRTNNVTIAKAIYTTSWGDIGNLTVSHLCKNKSCGNPLHLVSTWNRKSPPKKMHFFDIEYDPKKLIMFCRLEKEGFDLDNFFSQRYKNTIANPKDVDPSYNS
jgi:hypothetical protein|tara:strand:+ start:3965 stop:4627 length:663 start_codon:yes stop_codon:yes gene_type:complete